MANTATNVTVGKPKVGGAIYVAPLGSTLPTDSSTALDAAFKCLGYVSEDGVTNNNSPESDSVKAWGGDTVIVLQTDRPDSFAFTLLETLSQDVLNAIYGSANVVADAQGNLTVKATADAMAGQAWVIEMVMRGSRAKRIVIPDGAVTARETITYNDSDAVGYGITVSAYPDANGNTHKEYLEKAS